MYFLEKAQEHTIKVGMLVERLITFLNSVVVEYQHQGPGIGIVMLLVKNHLYPMPNQNQHYRCTAAFRRKENNKKYIISRTKGNDYTVKQTFLQQPNGLIFARIGSINDAQSDDIIQLLHIGGELRQR